MSFSKLSFVLIFLAAACLWSDISSSNDGIFRVEITADSLNIRSRPSTSGKVIGIFRKGQQVVAMLSDEKGWLMVLVNQGNMGFISAKYVEFVDVISIGSAEDGSYYEEEKCDADSAYVDLDISVTDFDCREGYLDDGFKSCETTINVSISSDCDEDMQAHVDCSVDIAYRTKDGYMERTSYESGSDTVYINYGTGHSTINVDWRPTGIYLDPVVRARVKDASCHITSVYDW